MVADRLRFEADRFSLFVVKLVLGCLFFHSMLDVRCSFFKTTPYGINATCEPLQNNLALMDQRPKAAPDRCALF